MLTFEGHPASYAARIIRRKRVLTHELLRLAKAGRKPPGGIGRLQPRGAAASLLTAQPGRALDDAFEHRLNVVGERLMIRAPRLVAVCCSSASRKLALRS